MTYTYSSFVPSRPAPSPPPAARLPPNHPFATFYIPPHPTNDSTESFHTFIDPEARRSSLPDTPSKNSTRSYISGSSSAPQSIYHTPPRHNARSKGPTSALAEPLSPRPGLYRTYTGYTTSPQSHSASSPTLFHSQESPISLPLELSLFDPRPRQTLLTDLETIFGKKLNFPLLSKFGKDRSMEEQDRKAGQKKKTKAKGEGRDRRVLRKERERSWEEDFIWRELGVTDRAEEPKRSAYRGNWI